MENQLWQKLYIDFVFGGLFVIGIWHLVAGAMTEKIFAQPRFVRLAGVIFILIALPCAYWQRPYFIVLGVVFLLSGLLRAVKPQFNIEIEKTSLPRWGHGLVICVFAVIGWVAYQFFG